MKRYFLETSVIVGYLRGKKETIELIESLRGELTSSFICLSELYEGIYRSKDKGEAEKSVLNFFAGLSEVFGLNAEIAENFGRIRAELKDKGNLIEDLDLLLAATCLSENITMVTANIRHFQRVPKLEIWPTAESPR